MKLFVGLGNPGRKYAKTRHNAGFMVVDKLCQKWNCELNKKKGNGNYLLCNVRGEDIILLEPQTYMNNSGESVVYFVKYFKIDIKDIIIVHDDMDLDVGRVRLRQKGSSGGQKGMADIIQKLGTSEIKRIRIGVGHPQDNDVIDYVLGKVEKENKEVFLKAIDHAAEALDYAVDNDYDRVMNKFNL